MNCPACGASVEPGARFCSSCGQQLVARHDERRIVTVLFADIVGFTSLSETSDPEQVKALVDEIFEAMAAEVTSFGGKVDRIAGDSLLALFGAPLAHEDDAERAVRAALKMHERLRECTGAEGVQMRIGVNTGEVLVGALSTGGSITAMGDVVNTAQRLEVAAEPGTVVVGPATHSATAAAIDYEPLGLLQAKGREERVDAWVARRAILPPGHRRRRTSGPLVGRDDEVTMLASAVATAVHRSRAQLILVFGEAGVGKSRLAEEVGEKARAVDEGTLVLEGRCVPYGEANVWWPVAEAIRQACGLAPDDPLEVAEERCLATVRLGFGPGVDDAELERVSTGLVHLMGYDTALRGIDPQRAREEATRSVLAFVEAAARETPVVIVLSDLHWADEAVLGLIGPLLDRASRRRFVLVATARHELEQRWTPPPGRHNSLALTLDPLDRGAAEALLGSLAEHELPAGLRDELIDRSGGNPLFIEELVALVAQQGTADTELPATLRGLISARIDALDDEERATLEDAAVWGGSGPTEALRKMAMARRHVADVAPALGSLVAKDVLGVDGEHWSFRSDLVREVTYAMLTKAHRAQSHHGIAEYLESISPVPAEAGDRTVDVIAHHYARAAELAVELGRVPNVPADVGARALPWLEEAAHRAATEMVPPVALGLQTSALRLLGDEPTERRVDLLLARARTAIELRDIDTADADVAEAKAIAGALDDELAEARARLVGGEIRLNTGEFERAQLELEGARAALAALGDEAGEAEAFRQIGMTHIFRFQNDEAEAAVTEALDRFRALGDRRGEAWALQNLAWIAYVQGRTAVAEDRIAVSARTFEEIGDRGGLGWALGLLAFVRFHQGDHDEAGRLGEQILAEARERGDTWAEGMMQLLLAGVRMWSGRASLAVTAAEEALARFRSIDDAFGQAQSLSTMARALAAVGRVPEANVRLEEAHSRYSGNPAVDVPVSVGIAGVAVFLGDPARALASLELADDIRSDLVAPANLGDGDRAVARALASLQVGDVDRALAILETVCEALGEGAFPYAESVLALAYAASGRHDDVAPLAASVRAAARSTYLDRATADMAEALSRVASGAGDGIAALDRLQIDLGATDDVLAQALAQLARAQALEVLELAEASDAVEVAERMLVELGIEAAGWRRLFRLILAAGPDAKVEAARAAST